MKLMQARIANYRSCQDVTIDFSDMHALVGANNAGKSCILRALDFFFNPSVTRLDAEAFWNGNETSEIRVEAVFGDLSEDERTGLLQPYLRSDGTFKVARTAGEKSGENNADVESKIVISQQYSKFVPLHQWLRDDKISTRSIAEWWSNKDSLVVRDESFADFLGNAKPSVGDWKAKAAAFANQHLEPSDFEEDWIDNPAGYAGVLKGALPLFILVPAVRDLGDEAKATKSNPFGRLLYALMSQVGETEKAELDAVLAQVRDRLNRAGGESRLANITKMEHRLNQILKDYMEADLEIQFQPPTLDVLFTTPRIRVDDGFSNSAENKGHGLQRSIIFTILQCYSELVSGAPGERTRPVIFAVEEPEIYMHPQAQRTIRRVFRKIADAGDQVMFSTHSSLLLDVAWFDEIIRVEKQITPAGDNRCVGTAVHQLPVHALLEDLRARYPRSQPTARSLRDHYSNAYHPNRADGFFASKVILVEGATEQYALPIYAESIGFELDKDNIAIVDCGGKGQMDRLYRIFNELGIPCYMLFDYDSSSKDNEIIRTSVELLKLCGADPAPPTTLYVGERLACFPFDWETQLRNEIDCYEERAGAARRELGIPHGKGKSLVARWVARKLLEEGQACPASVRKILEAAVAVQHFGTCLQRTTEKD